MSNVAITSASAPSGFSLLFFEGISAWAPSFSMYHFTRYSNCLSSSFLSMVSRRLSFRESCRAWAKFLPSGWESRDSMLRRGVSAAPRSRVCRSSTLQAKPKSTLRPVVVSTSPASVTTQRPPGPKALPGNSRATRGRAFFTTRTMLNCFPN